MASLRSLDQRVYPAAQALVRLLESAGVQVTVTSSRRDRDQQQALYDRYKAGKSKYPAAPPGHSMHALGLAFDLHLSDPRYYELAGRAWEGIGGTWGGRFGDEIHFDARSLMRRV